MTTVFREYIVDGYNLLHKLFSEKEQHTLHEKRERVETMLLGFQRSTRAKVTIVYDGQRARGAFRDAGALNRVFTSSGRSADDWIVDYLKSLGSKAQMFTIVSSDRFICRHATANGASYMLSENFIDKYLCGTKRHERKDETVMNRKKYSNIRLTQKEVDHWLELFSKTKE
ncbi:NYN domain-containing protein [Prosthecochloris sp. SCSIO W1101]|uniref:NYN domain-containing protein n=1 Tax=Prosthecochloris sp. SCSIO W1101 TaxID=2992242 RepID=UPI00223E267B|nr:NYN domain-containing protein [Prosthecochloris sp. SCSIO W1101]UZJ41417.1 NYN domain-containing protein [Prosthecochloris sp. SCSIO W1101]